MRPMYKHKGFTLIELIVVITIMALLMALTLPVAKSMIESNRVMTCNANLSRLSQALKMYYLDHQGVPPVWIAEDGSDPSTPYDEMLSPNSKPVDPVTGQETNPLMVLYREGYLRDRSLLHCPGDREHRSPTDPTYFYSYVWRQPDNTPAEKLVKIKYVNDQDNGDAWNDTDILVNRFKYMPCRIWTVPSLGPADPHTWAHPPSAYTAQRQLSRGMRSITVGSNMYWGPVTDSTWMPADSTVVTWCDYHADYYTQNGAGQYHVLFWDGSVALKARGLFERGPSPIPPPAAWEVAPGDR